MHSKLSLLLVLSIFTLITQRATVEAGVCRKKASKAHGFQISGYYPSYRAGLLPPESIPWDLYNHIDYFVAVTSESPSAEFVFDNEANVKAVIEGAKAHKVTVSLTIGGWTGSKYFSSLVSTDTSRETFAKTISSTLSKYGFDGVDLDWEYPNAPGNEGNIISKDDSANLLKFLTALRASIGSKRLTAAVSVHGFMGPDGQYLKDHKEYAKLFDFITIMAYDIYLPVVTPLFGPGAPLFDTCNDPSYKFSVAQAIDTWTSTGFPASQILLGIPAYGYQYTLSSSKLDPTNFSGKEKSLFFGPIDKSAQAQTVKNVAPTPTGCDSPLEGGNFIFKDLLTCGFLSPDAATGQGGFERHYDNCTQTPLLFNPTTKTLIAYDDPTSLTEKVKYAKSKGVAGVNVFDASGDTPSRMLLKSVSQASKL
ncbi:family 18 glycoside hydrolase [Melampsora americana]|nr:family 18 glycoside hydrolase [Melampsora americana]